MKRTDTRDSSTGLGVFGVMSSAVTARQRELGIRLALGARAGQVLRLVLARASTLVAIGRHRRADAELVGDHAGDVTRSCPVLRAQ